MTPQEPSIVSSTGSAWRGKSASSDDAVEAFYQQLQTRSPAVLVTTGSSTDEGRSTRATDFLERINVEVLVVSAHQRDRQ